MIKNCKIIGVGVDDQTYHDAPENRGERDYVVSSSRLRGVFAKSPRAWKNGWSMPKSEAMTYGSLFDCLVLTPELFASRYVVRPDYYEIKVKGESERKPWNNNAAQCREWNIAQKASGLKPISQNQLDEANEAVKRLLSDDAIAAFINGSEKQVWCKGEWHDDATGLVVPVQCLIDLVERVVPLTVQKIGDLKTTTNASPLPWARFARSVGYDVQAAWNLDLFNAASGREIDRFEFVLSESYHPYETGRRIAIDPRSGDPQADEGSAIVSGRRAYHRMMADYCQCLKRNYWPGYDDTDESSGGVTEFRSDPYEEQRRLFGPRLAFDEVTDENCDIVP